MAMKRSGRWFGLVGVALVVYSAAAYSGSDSSYYNVGCLGEFYGDSQCDKQNNNAECGYDGGDCCECTCEALHVNNVTFQQRNSCLTDDPRQAALRRYVQPFWIKNCRRGVPFYICLPLLHVCQCQSNTENDCAEFACIDPEAPCVNDDEATVEMVEMCGYAGSIGNGRCDPENNNEFCGYDGGDCCECTCVAPDSTWDDYACSPSWPGFACIDPEAPCVDDDDVTVEMVMACDNVQAIGDGLCNIGNNKEICGFDGGDCCECTCVPPESIWDDDISYSRSMYCSSSMYWGLACIDPAAPCVDDDDITADIVENCDHVQGIGNGYCDPESNNEQCDYDGGDCCECTCVTDDDYQGCGNGFACIDPEAPCVNDDDLTTGFFDDCDEARMGDASCDDFNNIPECNYDGGDCCSCTCEDTPNQQCGGWKGFACVDPEATCVHDDDITVDMLDKCGHIIGIGDGYCTVDNNIAECDYDGGDCCECTCVALDDSFDDDRACSWFACVDPAAECVDDDYVTVDMLDICVARDIGDGNCDDYNNREECAWDGGDCCSCTCDPGNNADDDCREFACIDPSAACVEDDDITIDMLENCGYVIGIGNGYCSPELNNEDCAYDGGDCCSCTCESVRDDGWACTTYDCKDPSATCFGEALAIYYSMSYSDSYTWEDDYFYSMSYSMSYSWEDDDYYSTSYLWIFEQDDDGTSDEPIPRPHEEPLPTIDGAVDVSTKTEVTVSATGFDARPAGEHGCGEDGGDGCAPQNTRDLIASDVESRWSCSPKLVEDGESCQIEYSFAAPQDVVDIQVAFWKGNERVRTLHVYLDGVRTHHAHESYAGSTFNTLHVEATGVSTVVLEAFELAANEWVSLIEVLIFVAP